MPFLTEPALSACPFCQINAFLGGAAEVEKKPNFIQFYEMSRSLGSATADPAKPGDQMEPSPTGTKKHESSGRDDNFV
jgi:hypothetical protein